ncbi:MAG: exo-alpha-sialidase [Variibacter sp.]|nr:exo-alpha-sialidase [Variibacter sp.]
MTAAHSPGGARKRPGVLAALALAGCLACGYTLARAPAWPAAFVPASPPRCLGAADFTLRTLRAAAPHYAHAASAMLLRDGRLRAFWYEGTEELERDVTIRTAVFDGARWGAPDVVIGPEATAAAEGLFVTKVGNALPYRNADGGLTLIYASVGLGGWSGASLNLIRSADEGATWSLPRRLITSATLNFSTLVRSPAVAMEGGFTLVPAYQEFLSKFPELLLLDRTDHVIGRRRLPGTRTIQPTLAVLDRARARVFGRTKTPRALPFAATADAGATWTHARETSLRGYDKPMAVLPLGGAHLLGVYNIGVAGAPIAYGSLAIGVSDDEGTTWRTIHTLDDGSGGHSDAHYPWLMLGGDGAVHLLYTRTLPAGSVLQHARFTRDWVAAQGGPPCP